MAEPEDPGSQMKLGHAHSQIASRERIAIIVQSMPQDSPKEIVKAVPCPFIKEELVGVITVVPQERMSVRVVARVVVIAVPPIKKEIMKVAQFTL